MNMIAIIFVALLLHVQSTNGFSPTHHASTSKTIHQTPSPTMLQANVNIRDWREGDGARILDLLQSAEDGSFNPEGALELDCQTEFLLSESYDPTDGGCFLVVESEDNTLVGVGGLIVGTPIEYQTSGSSVSSAQTTAAIRRCCVRTGAGSDNKMIWKEMINHLEKRANQAQATQVIALAYTDNKQKPSPALFEQLGYEKLAEQLAGVESAVQYGKDLSKESEKNQMSTTSNDNSDMVLSAVLAGALGFLVAGVIAVAQFIGLDIRPSMVSIESSDSINRGLGRPLSSEDLGELLQDEKLQRKSLDGGSSSIGDREWKDLSLEEQREEMALLGIVEGKDVRIK